MSRWLWLIRQFLPPRELPRLPLMLLPAPRRELLALLVPISLPPIEVSVLLPIPITLLFHRFRTDPSINPIKFLRTWQSCREERHPADQVRTNAAFVTIVWSTIAVFARTVWTCLGSADQIRSAQDASPGKPVLTDLTKDQRILDLPNLGELFQLNCLQLIPRKKRPRHINR